MLKIFSIKTYIYSLISIILILFASIDGFIYFQEVEYRKEEDIANKFHLSVTIHCSKIKEELLFMLNPDFEQKSLNTSLHLMKKNVDEIIMLHRTYKQQEFSTTLRNLGKHFEHILSLLNSGEAIEKIIYIMKTEHVQFQIHLEQLERLHSNAFYEASELLKIKRKQNTHNVYLLTGLLFFVGYVFYRRIFGLIKIARIKEKESEERIKLLLNSTGESIYGLNTEGVCTFVNSACLKTLGYKDASQLVGKKMHDLIHHTRKDGTPYPDKESSIYEIFRQGKRAHVDNEVFWRADGADFPVEYQINPVFRNEKIIGAVVNFTDITERKQAEEELAKYRDQLEDMVKQRTGELQQEITKRNKAEEEQKKVEKEKQHIEKQLLQSQKLESLGTLAGGISHDFNNILASIMGNISIVKMDLNPGDEAHEMLTKAETASMRAKDLAQQLRTFSIGGAPIKKTTFIKKLIKDTTSFALSGCSTKPAFFISDDLWPVNVDYGQISQVIHNLVINANEAMKDGGTIKILGENITLGAENLSLLKEGKYLKISIVDQGIGISEINLSKIFDPYFTTKESGSGLGLATCYSIIKKHDGSVTVESEPGVGTSFYIFLPASSEKIQKQGEGKKELIFGKGKILIMDDEEDVIYVLSHMLIKLGYDVESTKDGVEAIELFKKARESGQPFDTVILDLIIPGGMGGEKTIKKLLEINPDVKAIVSSGYSSDTVLSNYEKSGFISYLPKPYQTHEVAKIMHEILKG